MRTDRPRRHKQPTGCSLPASFGAADEKATQARFAKAGHNRIRCFYDPPACGLHSGHRQLVVDIGSFEGVDLKAFLRHDGLANVEVHTYEPVPATASALARSLAPFPQVHVHPFGLGGSNYSACVEDARGGMGTRLLRRDAPAACAPRRTAHVRDAVSTIDSLIWSGETSGHTVDVMQTK